MRLKSNLKKKNESSDDTQKLYKIFFAITLPGSISDSLTRPYLNNYEEKRPLLRLAVYNDHKQNFTMY
jgi:hypothetical protein